MNRVMRTNFLGMILSTGALLAAGAIASGCGNGVGGNGRTSNPPIGSIPGSATTLPFAPPACSNPNLADTSGMPAAHVQALLGSYGGTILVYDEENREIEQAYTITLTQAPSSQQPGKHFFRGTFQSGTQRLDALMTFSTAFGSFGPATYNLISCAQNERSITEDGPVVLFMQAAVNYANQIDLAYSDIRIALPSYFPGVPSQDVVYFNTLFKY